MGKKVYSNREIRLQLENLTVKLILNRNKNQSDITFYIKNDFWVYFNNDSNGSLDIQDFSGKKYKFKHFIIKRDQRS